MAFDITTKHPRWLEFAESWRTMRRAFDGEDVVKAAGEAYLPMKSGMAAISDGQQRAAAYLAYQARAEFPEIVAPTIRGALGMIHEQTAQITLTPRLEPLRERATLDGLTLDGLHRRVTGELLTTGRYGLLPALRGPRPFLAGYPAESIINWDETDLAVDFVVLDETAQVRDRADNSWALVPQYRELMLDGGAYVARVWRKNERGDFVPAEEARASRGDTARSPLSILPFVFITAMDLTPDPDDVPLWGLAKIALRIYRLDADLMHGLHMTSEPTPYVTGFDDPVRAAQDGQTPSAIGAAVMWVLPKGATAGFLEFSGPGLAAQDKAIQRSREAAVMFGAQMFADTSKTAESGAARRMRIGGQTATWRDIAVSSAAGVERALKNLAIWLGDNPDQVSVIPNLDFADVEMTSDEIRATVEGWQAGAYSYATMFERLQAGGVIPAERTLEQELDRLAQDGPDEPSAGEVLAAMTRQPAAQNPPADPA